MKATLIVAKDCRVIIEMEQCFDFSQDSLFVKHLFSRLALCVVQHSGEVGAIIFNKKSVLTKINQQAILWNTVP